MALGKSMKIMVEVGEEKDWNTFGATSWVLPFQVSWLWGQKGQWLGETDGKPWDLLKGEGCNSPHNKGRFIRITQKRAA